MIFQLCSRKNNLEKEHEKIQSRTRKWTLTFVMTGRSALSIELIKATGEQAIVSL